ncbi:hypothetical protein HPB50_009164 [Hyalomma asiaticum]|uniref:Uncharacterized protein n=1 Tax=Hyalomma asiaticum TaxID=266040 RepID=A0ACB7SZ49_HYAAI|nr:hypothetical protein HPB50_009164 [Hyalomma asiaticum]
MFALVRFLDAFDKKESAVLASNIKDFPPANDHSSRNKVYTTFWVEVASPENNRPYPSQVLQSANSREELEKKKTNKRLCKGVINPSDIEIGGGSDTDAPASQKQAPKQANKKSRRHEDESKKSAYQNILKEHLKSSFQKNEGARTVQDLKRKRKQLESDSDSGTDDDVVSLKELKRAKADVRYWRSRYEASCKENAELRAIVASMNNKIDTKLSTIVEMLECRRVEVPSVQESLTGCLSQESHFEDIPETAPLAEAHPASPDPVTSNNLRRQPAEEALPAVDSQVASQKAFTDIGGGRVSMFKYAPGSLFQIAFFLQYHVANSFCIGSQQVQKILSQKKPSLVAKDMAQAIWGCEALANRTHGRKLAPKDYGNPDATVRKQMSPEKVALIIKTATHWGAENGTCVKKTIENLSSILSQKIQDVRKSLKRNGKSTPEK